MIHELDDTAERAAWMDVLAFLVRTFQRSWPSVIGGYLRKLVLNLPMATDDDGRRCLVRMRERVPDANACTELQAAWAAVRCGRVAGTPPTKQYDYIIDHHLHATVRHINPRLAAEALPLHMPTGWSFWSKLTRPIRPSMTTVPCTTHTDAEAVPRVPPPVVDTTNGEEQCQMLERCTTVVERLLFGLLTETTISLHDLRRVQYDPTGEGNVIRLVRWTGRERVVRLRPELALLAAEWYRSSIRSEKNYLFPHTPCVHMIDNRIYGRRHPTSARVFASDTYSASSVLSSGISMKPTYWLPSFAFVRCMSHRRHPPIRIR